MNAKRALTQLGNLLPQRSDYTAMRRAPLRDLLAGVTVAIVALPLALAFGVASGLGAESGLITAIIAGIVAAIFGGSNLQVSGPTGAMTVVLVPVVHTHGATGVLQVGLMAGVILIILAITRVGRYVRYIPASVVEGFTAGIAVVIALQQVPNMLGVPPSDAERVWALAFDAIVAFTAAPDFTPLIIALVVAAVILIGARLRPSVPASFIVVILATVAAVVFAMPLDAIGELPQALPPPDASFFEPSRLGDLLPSAIAVAALAALESLLCATVADGMSVGERHDPDRELFGQGMANLVVPFFGGVPATAAIARTAVNVRNGARSRLSVITHSLVLLAVVLAVGPLVGLIPLAALAGVLLATTVQMISFGSISSITKATRGDAAVLLLTFGITVAFDLVAAVLVGLAVAALLALRAVSRSAQLEQVPLDLSDHSLEEQELLRQHIVAFRFDGPLFFGAAHRFLLELSGVSNVRVVILRMSRVSALDATGALMLDDAIKRLEHRGIAVFLSGITDPHDQILSRIGAADHLRELGRVLPDTPAAIAAARALVLNPKKR